MFLLSVMSPQLTPLFYPRFVCTLTTRYAPQLSTSPLAARFALSFFVAKMLQKLVCRER